jgi:hypothetical protein
MQFIMKFSTVAKSLVGVAAVGLPLLAAAESNIQTSTTGAALSASARVNFSIVIPKALYLRVGTGSAYTTGTLAANATVDTVTFSPAAGAVGSGTPVAGTGGDLTGGVETAAVVSNGGNVSLVATATGALSDGAGNTIPYTQITTAASAGTYATLLNAPTLANGTSNTITLTAPASKIITADAKWTYQYANAAAVPAGTYGNTVANNGQVTYTATMP